MTKEVTYNFKYEKKLYIMVGNIGCGKSTYVKNELAGKAVVVSRDSLRYMFGNGMYIFDRKLEKTVSVGTKSIIDELMNTDVNIVLDETNVNSVMRGLYIAKAKYNDYKVIAVVLPRLPMEHAVDNRMKDPHGQPYREIWEGVWGRFNEMYEDPIIEEGFDEIVLVK